MFDVLGFFKLLVREGTDAFETDDSLRSVISPLGVELADSGLLGFDLPMCLGGCGNEPMLTVFRSVLPAELSVAGKEGTEGEVMCFAPARGRADEDTARFAVEGLGRSEPRPVVPTFEVRVLGTGNEGKGPVGGAIDGLDGRGSELTDMMVVRVGGCRVCEAAVGTTGRDCQRERLWCSCIRTLWRRMHVRRSIAAFAQKAIRCPAQEVADEAEANGRWRCLNRREKR